MKLPAKVSMASAAPNFILEDGFDGRVCGIDEVGRGPLAGPVVAACVYIPQKVRTLPFVSEIRDSKKLSASKLEKLYLEITKSCDWAVAESAPAVIDDINILQASLLAMNKAFEQCGGSFNHALVDGNKLPVLPCPASAIVKGDAISTSIAAASIVAKVTRDRIMCDLHVKFPQFGWNKNVGYPTKAHIEALSLYGVTEFHRKTFGPVRCRLAQNPAEFESKKRA